MKKSFQLFHIKLDGLSKDQLAHTKQTINEATGARFSNAELVRCGIDLVSRELDRLTNNPERLAERIINKFGKYRWARTTNSNYKRRK